MSIVLENEADPQTNDSRGPTVNGDNSVAMEIGQATDSTNNDNTNNKQDDPKENGVTIDNDNVAKSRKRSFEEMLSGDEPIFISESNNNNNHQDKIDNLNNDDAINKRTKLDDNTEEDLDAAEHISNIDERDIDQVLERLISNDRDTREEEEEDVVVTNHTIDDDIIHLGFDSSEVHNPHIDPCEVEVTTENTREINESTEESANEIKSSENNPRGNRRTRKPVISLPNPTDKELPSITKKRIGPKSRIGPASKTSKAKRKSKVDDDDTQEENYNSDATSTETEPKPVRSSNRPQRSVVNKEMPRQEDDNEDEDVEEEEKQEDNDDDDDQTTGPSEFVVEKILSKRDAKDSYGNNRVEYKVKWEGYPNSANTWEPLCNLADCEEAIKAFEESHALMISKKKISMANANSGSRRKDDSDDDVSPQKKYKKTFKEPSLVDKNEVEVKEIIGLSRCGSEKYFLLKFHESSNREPQFLRSTVAAKLIPLKVIDFYTKNVVWK